MKELQDQIATLPAAAKSELADIGYLLSCTSIEKYYLLLTADRKLGLLAYESGLFEVLGVTAPITGEDFVNMLVEPTLEEESHIIRGFFNQIKQTDKIKQSFERGVSQYFMQFHITKGKQTPLVRLELATYQLNKAVGIHIYLASISLIKAADETWSGYGTLTRKGSQLNASYTIKETAVERLMTNRQIELFRLMYQGYTSRAAAQKMGISENTVLAHRKAIFSILGVNKMTEAVSKGMALGLLVK